MEASVQAPDWLNVSRETLDRLTAFCALVERWTPTINLVSKTTLAQIWERHLLDSAQVFALAPQGAKSWVDLGSGGGFPGIVVAILALQNNPDLVVTLVESDRRKSVFLTEAGRVLGLKIRVLSQRIETLPVLSSDVLSARALAPLSVLCGYAATHLDPTGMAIFQKGATHADETVEARKSWSFDAKIHASKTDATAVVLEVKAIRHV